MRTLDDVGAPHCPSCLRPMKATVGAWWCPACELRVEASGIALGEGASVAVANAWAEAVVKAVGGALGPLGQIASLLVDGTFSARNAVALERWLAIVDERFTAAGRMFNPDDPIAMAHFNRLTQGALQTHRDKRRRMLADAAINVGETSAFEDALQRRLVALTLRLEPEHIAYMRLLLDPMPFVSRAGRYGVQEIPDLPLAEVIGATILRDVEEIEIVRESIGRDLMNEGLVASGYGSGATIGDIDPYPVLPLGLRLLDFLEGSLKDGASG